MTLVILWLEVVDMPKLQQQFEERQDLKATHGCTSSRLMVDRQNPASAVVLMEFASHEAARGYLSATLGSLGAGELSEMTSYRLLYLEDAPSAAAASSLANGADVLPVVS